MPVSMKTRYLVKGKPSEKAGIALVVVLGFVSLLMLMIVGFAISQRVERLVARAWLDGLKADQLIDAALARALDSLDQNLSPAGQPGQTFPDFRNFNEGSWSFADAVGSMGSGANVPTDWLSTLTNALPQVLHAEAQNALDQTQWQEIDSTNRIAWVAVNCSGFLDANRIAQTNRAAGWSPSEIPLPMEDAGFSVNALTNTWIQAMDQQELRQIVGTAPQFLSPFSYAPPEWDEIPVVLDQANDGRYRYINREGEVEELDVPTTLNTWGGKVNAPNWLCAYSKGEQTAWQLNIETNNGDLALIFLDHWRAMLNHFKDDKELYPSTNSDVTKISPPYDSLEITSRMMCDLFGEYNVGKGLINVFEGHRFRKDFYEAGSPINHYRGCHRYLQPGLHVTQIWGKGTPYPDFDQDGNSIDPVTNLWIELEVEYTNPFNIPIDVSFMRAFNRINLHDTGRALTGKWKWSKTPLNPDQWESFPYNISYQCPTNSEGRVAPHFKFHQPLLSSVDNSIISPKRSLRVHYGIMLTDPVGLDDLRVFYSWGGVYRSGAQPDAHYVSIWYDWIKKHLGNENNWRFFLTHTGDSREFRLEADDPRLVSLGLRSLDKDSAFVDLSYLGSVDPITYSWMNSSKQTHGQNGCDGAQNMYAVNYLNPKATTTYPELDSVAHIGRQSLSNNKMWTTIPLLGDRPQAVDVARYFVMKPEQYTERRGKININSPYREVLAAGFMEANTDMTGADVEPLSKKSAFGLADLILHKRPAAGYANTVDVWRAATRDEWIEAAGVQDKFQAEEIVARSMHLFTTRQQIFTILLAAQTRSPAGEVRGESCALAVVWRDPFRTDEDGKLDEANGRNRVKLLAWRRLDQ